MYRAASSRWCPTPEQVMILEEFYRAGVRTPNATQIQKIACYLSYHGKIEGKNVFYWFQNHKARERQKLRKTHNCQLAQVQLLNSTFCHGLRRAASFGLHQAPLCTCTSSSPPVVAFLNQQDAAAAAAKEMSKWTMRNNYRRRHCGNEASLSTSNFMIKEYDQSWRAAVSNNPTLCFSSPPQSSPPIRTLQLFPVKTTHLRQEPNPSL